MATLKGSTVERSLVQTMMDRALEHHREGRLVEAEQAYQQVLAIDADHADSLHLLGMIAYQAGDCDTALERIRRAIAINPRAASYHSNLGNVLQHLGYAREAASCYLRALVIKPTLAEAQVNLANIFLAAGETEHAVEWYQRALALTPNLPEAHKNLGDALRIQMKLDLAVASYERAIALRPEYADALNELGGVHRAMNDLDGALTRFRQAQAIQPDHPRAGFGEALVQLMQGNFQDGWSSYERRWDSTDHATPMREYRQPAWRGEPRPSGKILLWPEQGVGDEIMFAGMIPDLMRTEHRCILECEERLQTLFARSFPGVEVISDREAAFDSQRQIVAHLPIGSLPLLFRRDRSAFASVSSPYLKADSTKLEQLRTRYDDGRLRVGLAWYSNNQKTGSNRSIRLSVLLPLLAQPEVSWVSLQYGEHAALQLEVAAAQAPILVDPEVDQFTNLDAFAAQIAAMDLVITIDNTTAHLAGALGVPVWVLVPYAPDWRWLLNGDDSPWYPSLRLFRQPKRHDWETVVERVRESLAAFEWGFPEIR